MRLALAGLGRMGSGMARNLLRAGHELTVYNRTPGKAAPLEAGGARISASPKAACEGCEAVITMLADDAAVEAVIAGPNGILAGLEAGAVHISSSTISAALARRLVSLHEERGQAYLSAPVFGRPEAAESAQLVVVAAGVGELIARMEPVFGAIGRETRVAGSQPWQANAVKLCGNFLLAAMLEGIGETFAVMRKAGVDPRLFLDIVNELFRSPVYANYGRIIVEERFEPAGFALRLGLKDLRLAVAAAEEWAVPMPLASVIKDRFVEGMALGQADLDWSSIARVAARNAGL